MSKFRADTFVVGAVAYAPKVVTIWEGFKDYFTKRGLPLDYILYSNYETQVEALLAGQCDVAWNSPLAWIRAERLAAAQGKHAQSLVMRDTDCDLTSILLVKSVSPIHTTAELKGKTIAVGAVDSPQATLLPVEFLQGQGLNPGTDFAVQYHNILSGKHGDHIGGEREAVQALMAGTADAACLIKGNYDVFVGEGIISPGAVRILTETPRFDHCNFTALAEETTLLTERFRALLLAMSYDDLEARPYMELEGVTAWRDGRTEGYKALNAAVDQSGFYDQRGKIAAQGYMY